MYWKFLVMVALVAACKTSRYEAPNPKSSDPCAGAGMVEVDHDSCDARLERDVSDRTIKVEDDRDDKDDRKQTDRREDDRDQRNDNNNNRDDQNNNNNNDDNNGSGDPNVVEFRIKAGTGQGSWNTQAEMVEVKVGQTLRVINEDNVRHRLHTNGTPCPHGPDFNPGATFDCVIRSAFDPGTRPLYDHNAGQSAQFWFRATR